MTNKPQPSGAAPVVVQAKSLEQALVKAAGVLGTTQDQVRYRVTREDTKRGIFSFFKNPVVEIQAWAEAATGRGSTPRNRADRQPDAAFSQENRPKALPSEQVDALVE